MFSLQRTEFHMDSNIFSQLELYVHTVHLFAIGWHEKLKAGDLIHKFISRVNLKTTAKKKSSQQSTSLSNTYFEHNIYNLTEK